MLEKFSGTPWISTKLSSQTRKKAVNCHLSGSSQPFLNSKIPETISNVDLTLFCNQNTGDYIKCGFNSLFVIRIPETISNINWTLSSGITIIPNCFSIQCIRRFPACKKFTFQRSFYNDLLRVCLNRCIKKIRFC